MIERFQDRIDAGRQLAVALKNLSPRPDIVLALPRGGVPVGAQVAHQLQIPLQVFVVRKLGVPGHEEYAMGALASGNVILLNHEVIQQIGLSQREVDTVIEKEKRELERRERQYIPGSSPLQLEGRNVVLVDDGLATGSSMKAAVQAVRLQGARSVTVAVPVAPASARWEFETIADHYVTVMEPQRFYAVGQWYENFSQTTDEEVQAWLAREPAGALNR